MITTDYEGSDTAHPNNPCCDMCNRYSAVDAFAVLIEDGAGLERIFLP